MWGLVVDNVQLVDFNKDNPFNERFIKIFEPKKIANRITSQNSWFSIQNITVFGQGGNGLPAFDEYNVMNEMEEFEFYISRIIVPNDIRLVILRKLDSLGVNYYSIFPGLLGLCKSIIWKEFEKNHPTITH